MTELSAPSTLRDRLGALLAFGSRISAADSEEAILTAIVEQCGPLAGASAAVVGLVEGDQVSLAAALGYPEGYLDPWQTFALTPGTPMTDVLVSGKPVYCTSREERDRHWPVFRGTGADGSEAFVVLPLAAHDGLIGAVTLSYRGARPFDEDDRLFLETFAGLCALALERTRVAAAELRAHAAERAARERTERLQRFTVRLAPALTVDDVAVITVNKGLVASRGLTCLIALQSRDGRHLELRHVEGEPSPRPGTIRLFTRDDPSVIGEVFRTGEPLWIHNRAEWEEFDEAIGRPPPLRSAAILPIAASGQFFGVLGIAFAEDKEFPEDERAFLMAIAGQAALAFDRAQLHEEQSEIAQVLQESLIPQELSPIPGCRVAVSYRAAGRANLTGGDFYDAFPVGDEHMLVVGDVCGKGAQAAALTSLCRYTLRAAALQTAPPDAVGFLTFLNRAIYAQSHEDTSFASVICALATQRGDGVELTLAIGGHPPAIVRRADGSIDLYESGGPVVGAFEQAAFSDVTVRLEPGDALILHTDGLTDARIGGARFGEQALWELVASLAKSSPQGFISAFDRLLDGAEISDDVAIVVAMPSVGVSANVR